jgi:hypothetical protein
MPEKSTAVPAPADKAEAGETARLPYWCIMTRELDDLGLTKAEFRIFCHVCRRAGSRGACTDKIRTLAKVTRTHPDWARWVIQKLVERKLLVRTRRPGETNILEPCAKLEWLAKYGTDADKVPSAYEETKSDIANARLWSRLWAVIPDAPKTPFQAQLNRDPWLFERVLAEVENRIKRGERVGADHLNPVKNPRGMWNYTWKQFEAANPAGKRGTV